jgi:deoxyribose-phosphate aldolase
MSKSIKINKAQADFIKMITGTDTIQDATDKLVELMVEENLPREHIVALIDRCMKKYPKK